jgi:hypothetical protein
MFTKNPMKSAKMTLEPGIFAIISAKPLTINSIIYKGFDVTGHFGKLYVFDNKAIKVSPVYLLLVILKLFTPTFP